MKNKLVLSLILSLVWLSMCGVTCHPYGDNGGAYHYSIDDCEAHFQYIVYALNSADSIGLLLFDENNVLESGKYNMQWYNENERFIFGPSHDEDLLDSLTLKISFFCNNQWLESRDYKFLNRKDAFTHIDYKEQTEGELMFDAELDSVCPGLSNYRITQYTDSECLEELNSK